MHSSTSPCQNGWPPSSQRAFAPTSATVARAPAEAGSRPNSRSWLSAKWVAVQGWPSCLPRLAGEAGRHERPAGPLAVRVAMREQPRAPALGLDAGALRRPFGLGRVHQVAQHLPADRRVRVEQPVDDGTGRGHGRRDSPGRRAFNRPAGAAAVGRLEPRPASVYRAGLPNREHNETPWPPAFVARGARPARGEAT